MLDRVVQSVQKSSIAFSKYITANDVGATGAHQAGFHIQKKVWPLFFDTPGTKGTNRDKYVTIRWQNDFETSSRFIYYGNGTRNEYRLTRFGRDFPFLHDNNIGDLLVLAKMTDHYYEGWVLQSDEDIDEFFIQLNISPAEINGIIPRQDEQNAKNVLLQCFDTFIQSLQVDFPSTTELSARARSCYNKAYHLTSERLKTNPDKCLLDWIDTEYQLFKFIENNRYSTRIQTPFTSVEELVETANTILNRRKSRAGKSLEHHLEEIFNVFSLKYNSQAVTEINKRPDFLFPSQEAYANLKFDENKLVVLASKTTCKDRWRQILNEADRVRIKHLFTLQQGISSNQLAEMYKSDVCLVVPKPYISSFPEEYHSRILTLNEFIKQVKVKQGL
ncbi:type II restriction endonuclease [Alistipes putredinis]